MKIYLTKTSQCLLFLLVCVISGLAQNNNSLVGEQDLELEAKIFYNSVTEKYKNDKELETAYEMSKQYLNKYGKLELMHPSLNKKASDVMTEKMIAYEQKASKQALEWLEKNLIEYGSWSYKKDDGGWYLQDFTRAYFRSCSDISWTRKLELASGKVAGQSFSVSNSVELNILNLDSDVIAMQVASSDEYYEIAPYTLILKGVKDKPAFKVRTENQYSEPKSISFIFQDKDIAPRMKNAFVQAIKYCTIIKQREKANQPF